MNLHVKACSVFHTATQKLHTKIPCDNSQFPEFSRINKFPEISRFARVVSTLNMIQQKNEKLNYDM